MTVVDEFLITINKAKHSGIVITKDEIHTILKAAKDITANQKMIDTLILFQSTFITNEKTKDLTSRENQILEHIGNGKTSKLIAKNFNLSISTIETHRKNIRKKLGLVGKGKLIHFAIINNLQNNKRPNFD